MPIVVITGPPFSGKGQFARAEIVRRETDGELGLVALDYTPLFTAIVPGEQSAFRDAEVADTGAPRLAGYAFAVLLAALLDRELSGYVAVPSPRRAIEISDKAGGAPILDIDANVEDIATRIKVHMRNLQKTVPRATRARTVGRCRGAATAYLTSTHVLVGGARTVTRRGDKWKIGEPKLPFNRAAFERGLTPAGRRVRDELKAAGHADPDPAAILSELITDRRMRNEGRL